MTKAYRKTMNSNKQPKISRMLLAVVISFLCGYLSASFFTFTNARDWMLTHLLTTPDSSAVKPAVVHAELPKPKFEFYTMLAKDSTHNQIAQPPIKTTQALPVEKINEGSVPVTQKTKPVEIASPLAAKEVKGKVNADKKIFLMQIASFKNKKDAERMKAGLILKDFNVSISPFIKDHTTWYRVVLGPYETRLQAEKAQTAVARSERVMGMIRKMDA